MKSGTYRAGEPQLAREILAYFAQHPDARDTLEGIVEWWLLEQHIICQTAQVKDALAELVARGWVLKQRGKDLRTHYRLNRDKAGEIAALLKPKAQKTGQRSKTFE